MRPHPSTGAAALVLDLLVALSLLSSSPVQADSKDEARRLYKLGAMAAKKGHCAEAVKAFDRSYLLHPHAYTLFNAARCLVAMKRYSEAYEYFRKVETQSDNPVLRRLARQESDKIKGKFPVQPKVVAVKPVKPVKPALGAAQRSAAAAQVAAGRAELRRGSYAKAREAFLEALKADPKDAAARGGLGEVAFELGNYAEASAHLRSALRLNPRSGRYLVMLGNVYFKQGTTAAAVEQYRRALKVNGNNSAARSALDAALRRISLPTPKQPPAPQTLVRPVASSIPLVQRPSDGPRWYADWLGWTLVGGGAAVLIAGLATTSVGTSKNNDAPQQPTEAAYLDARDSGRTIRTGGLVMVGLGSAAILGGAIRFWLNAAHRRQEAATAVSVLSVPGGFGLSWGGSY